MKTVASALYTWQSIGAHRTFSIVYKDCVVDMDGWLKANANN